MRHAHDPKSAGMSGSLNVQNDRQELAANCAACALPSQTHALHGDGGVRRIQSFSCALAAARAAFAEPGL